MLTFLRKIRKSLIDTGSGRKYILYALGEILLVMVGILLALQVSTWNHNKVRKNEEREILKEMRASLIVDIENFTTGFEVLELLESRIETLQDVIQSEAEVDSIEILCGAVYGIRRFELNTASYEELKSSGFNLISDDNLRRLIIKIFDTHIKMIDHTNKIEDNVVLEALSPFYLSNFTDIRFSISATPYDIRTVYSDKYYHNLIAYRLTVLRTLSLSNYPKIIEDMNELIIQIDMFLND